MNQFTADAANVAYEECREHRRRKGDPVVAKDLVTQMDRVWVVYRDATIGRWAKRLVTVCEPDGRSGHELESLVREVSGLLVSWNTFWETPLWEPEGAEDRKQLQGEQVAFVSWGIACIWWMLHEGTEIAPLLSYTCNEIEAWLRGKERSESLITREKIGAGRVVEQHLMFAPPRKSTEIGEAAAQLSLLRESVGMGS